jgi:hypothetical protein
LLCRSYLAHVPWLAKDMVWLIPSGEQAGVAAWLRQYYTPVRRGRWVGVGWGRLCVGVCASATALRTRDACECCVRVRRCRRWNQMRCKRAAVRPSRSVRNFS